MSLNVLSNSYPVDHSLKFQLKLASYFALFVFLFLYFFQPFQISLLNGNISIISAGFALVTCMAMFLLNGIIPLFYPKYFDESNWTVGKEIFYTLLNLWFIGILNFLYYNYFHTNHFSWSSLLWFQLSTIAIGIFPIVFIILFKESKGRKKYTEGANSLSNQLNKLPQNDRRDSTSIFLPSQNKNDSISISADKLYFLQAADNYIEVYFMENALQKKLIQNTLKSIEKDLNNASSFFRCHKSYIVNLDKVTKVSGECTRI